MNRFNKTNIASLMLRSLRTGLTTRQKFAISFVIATTCLTSLFAGSLFCSCKSSNPESDEIQLVQSYIASDARELDELLALKKAIFEINNAELTQTFDSALMKYPTIHGSIFQKPSKDSSASSESTMTLNKAIEFVEGDNDGWNDALLETSPADITALFSHLASDKWPYEDTEHVVAFNGASMIVTIIDYLESIDSLYLIDDIPISVNIGQLDKDHLSSYYWTLVFMKAAQDESNSIDAVEFALILEEYGDRAHIPLGGLLYCAPYILRINPSMASEVAKPLQFPSNAVNMNYINRFLAFGILDKFGSSGIRTHLSEWPEEDLAFLIRDNTSLVEKHYAVLPDNVRILLDEYVRREYESGNYKAVSYLMSDFYRSHNISVAKVIVESEKPIYYSNVILEDEEFNELRTLVKGRSNDYQVLLAIFGLRRAHS